MSSSEADFLSPYTRFPPPNDSGSGELQVKMKVDCNIVKDVLKGDDVTELRVQLISIENEIYPYKDDD